MGTWGLFHPLRENQWVKHVLDTTMIIDGSYHSPRENWWVKRALDKPRCFGYHPSRENWWVKHALDTTVMSPCLMYLTTHHVKTGG